MCDVILTYPCVLHATSTGSTLAESKGNTFSVAAAHRFITFFKLHTIYVVKRIQCDMRFSSQISQSEYAKSMWVSVFRNVGTFGQVEYSIQLLDTCNYYEGVMHILKHTSKYIYIQRSKWGKHDDQGSALWIHSSLKHSASDCRFHTNSE